ncbi:glycoside hydrolase family 92 protein, partial [Phocaeicola vulgatus]|uniref:glycoside hydrolase domain-containing protein n=1 Tax=Phocaeicola vulgatus TaxID=821 RepID=UPI001D032A32
HTMVHPNILQDVSGQDPQMERDKIMTTNRNRYTVFSLWDTYSNYHQLMTLVYPERQMNMIHTMMGMDKGH